VIGVTSSEGLLAINCCLQDCGKKDEEEWDNVRCYEFDCDIGVLDAGAYVVIELRARLWNSTFLEVSHVTGLQQHVNGHFPGEPGLACSTLVYRFLWGFMHLNIRSFKRLLLLKCVTNGLCCGPFCYFVVILYFAE